MGKNRNEEEHEANHERWLLTYSDMITLLLVLFIMMYCISNVDSSKFKTIAQQLGIAFESGRTVVDSIGSSDSSYETSRDSKVTSFPISSEQPSPETSGDTTEQNIEYKLKKLIETAGLGGLASVRLEERGVVVSFQDTLLFDSGSANITPASQNMLKNVAGIVNSVDNYIRVEGSTDNVPINTEKFPSNWELASQRAINVVKMLINEGVGSSRVSAISYGEYRPIAANDTEDNKQLNRRVDIVFVNIKLNEVEAGYNN